MVIRSVSGTSACLTVVALAVLAGCQPKSGVVAKPAHEVGQTTSQTTTTTGGTTTIEAPVSSDTPTSSETPVTTPPVTRPTTETQAGSTTIKTPGADVVDTPTTGPVTLRIVLDKGQELKYKSTSESESKFSGGQMKMPEMKPVVTTSETLVKVVDRTGDKAKVEMTVGNLSMAGGMSDANTQKQMQKMAKDTAGVKVSAMFDPLGTPSGLKYEKGDRMQAMAAGIDSDTGFFGISYPSKAVNPGDTWTHDFDFKNAIGAFGPMANANWSNSKIVTKFTLKSIDRAAGTALISISAGGTPSMTMKMPAMGKGAEKTKVPSEVKMTFKVSGTGTATVELKNGLPKQIDYAMSTEFANPMGGGSMTQKTKAVLKRQ